MLKITPLLIMHEVKQKKCSSDVPELCLPNFIISEIGLHWSCVIHRAEMDLACFLARICILLCILR